MEKQSKFLTRLSSVKGSKTIFYYSIEKFHN